MGIDFYMHPLSPPCRSVKMTAQYLGIQLNMNAIDVIGGETKKSEFLKINPLGTVPTIDDDGFCLWESRAIMAYLFNKYAPGNPVYPQDPKKRAIVDRMLYFDIGTLFNAEQEILRPIFRQGKSLENTPPEKMEAFMKTVELLQQFLSNTKYVAGDDVTIADFALLSSMSCAEFVKLDFADYPKISEWMGRVKEMIPSYEEMDPSAVQKLLEDSKLKKK